MTTCTKCNAQFEDGLQHCTSCGAPSQVAPSHSAEPADFSAKLNEFNNTPDSTAEFDAADIEKNKVIAVFAYVIFLIPLLAAKDSPFAKFHTNQGLVLFIAGLISSVVSVIPVIGWILAPIGAIIVSVFAIIGIINAFGGKAKELPLIGKFRILK